MANYYATTRSNYFRVKNTEAFLDWCSERSLEHWAGGRENFHAISADNGDYSGWPSWDHAEDHEIDFAAELAEHLDPRDVAVLLESGSEKLRYITGVATAVHPNGETVTITLADIYKEAQEAFGDDMTVTEAIY